MAKLVSKVYSEAIFSIVSVKEETASKVLDEFLVVIKSFEENPAFVEFLSMPVITNEDKKEALKGIFEGKIDGTLMNFFYCLVDKNRFSEIFDIYEEFLILYNEMYNIMNVTAVTAVAMGDGTRQKLLDKLQKDTKKTVILECEVDPSILGGILLKTKTNEIDNTLRTKLKNIHNSIKQTII